MERVDFVFLDSGTGGIPYMLDLKQKCPEASCVYLGDTKNFPYGEKSESEIISCAKSVVGKAIEKWNAKAVVIACNTMSVTALSSLRLCYPEIPIIGTVPAVRLAAKESAKRRIGLLATNATVNHPYTQKLIDDFASDCVVEKRGDPELVSFIEHSLFFATDEEKKNAVKPSLDFFASKDCDAIILGCTHFTHIADIMRKEASEGVKIIDSRNGVSNHALDVAEKKYGKNFFSGKRAFDKSFFVTKAPCEKEEMEYKTLCSYFDIPWGGEVDF